MLQKFPTMASATARPTFSFHLHSSQTQQSPSTKPRTNLIIPPLSTKKLLISPLLRTTTTSLQFTTLNSIDVSKQDKPISEEPDSTTTSTSPSPSEPPPLTAEEEQEIEEKFDKKRLEERFAVLNTGIHECRSCGYRYNEAAGDSSYPIPPGLPFARLPEDWRCPTCGAAQSFFVSKSVEIAGFAENQQFGFGANTLTSGQKLILIYGGLGLLFVLFLSGYFLQ